MTTVRVRAAALAFGAAFVLSVAGSEALVVAAARCNGAHGAEPVANAARLFALSSDGLMACGCFEGLLLLAVAVVFARLEGRGVRARLRLGPGSTPLGVGAAAALGLVGLMVALDGAIDLAGLRGGGVMDLVAAALRRPSLARLGVALVTLCAVPAVGEEALFRGYIQPQLSASVGPWPAIALSAGAFGAFHRDAVQGCAAFVAGLFLGWIAERSGRIGPAILAHALSNATSVVLASLGAADGLSRAGEIAALAAGAALFAASAALLARSTRPVEAAAGP